MELGQKYFIPHVNPWGKADIFQIRAQINHQKINRNLNLFKANEENGSQSHTCDLVNLHFVKAPLPIGHEKKLKDSGILKYPRPQWTKYMSQGSEEEHGHLLGYAYSCGREIRLSVIAIKDTEAIIAMDMDKISMEGNFLNNPFVNCCFITTYAGVVAHYIQKGANWFNFTVPTIGSFGAPPNGNASDTSSSSGYESSLDTISSNSSNNNSPRPRPRHRYNRISQKERRRLEKEARLRAQVFYKNKTQIECPVDCEIKAFPSKYYQFDAVDDYVTGDPFCLVGMKPDVEVTKVRKPFKKVDNKTNKRKKKASITKKLRKEAAPAPTMSPKKKDLVVIDEDGFQSVLMKKAAKVPAHVMTVTEAKKEAKKTKSNFVNQNKSISSEEQAKTQLLLAYQGQTTLFSRFEEMEQVEKAERAREKIRRKTEKKTLKKKQKRTFDIQIEIPVFQKEPQELEEMNGKPPVFKKSPKKSKKDQKQSKECIEIPEKEIRAYVESPKLKGVTFCFIIYLLLLIHMLASVSGYANFSNIFLSLNNTESVFKAPEIGGEQ